MPNTSEQQHSVASQDYPRAAVESALAEMERLQAAFATVRAPEFAHIDLTMAQAKILYLLLGATDSTVTDVSQKLGVTVSTASGAVDRLVELGLVDRRDAPNDRRSVRLSLTPAGIDAIGQIREFGAGQWRTILEAIDDVDLAIVQHAMQIIRRAIATGGGHE